MSRSVYRYQVGLGAPVEISLTGEPVAFGALGYSAGIEFWAEHDDAKPAVPRVFVIVGTGHRVPDGAVYVGTAPRTREGLVWHLYEMTGAGR
ncbi:MAG TPA: hypothetical protein VK599_22250 [Streptosporangiaceae bacterium]|nr:hypothetical protein [Streptosporangiaceae bacterium]